MAYTTTNNGRLDGIRQNQDKIFDVSSNATLRSAWEHMCTSNACVLPALTYCKHLDTHKTNTKQTCNRTTHNGKMYPQHYIQGQKYQRLGQEERTNFDKGVDIISNVRHKWKGPGKGTSTASNTTNAHRVSPRWDHTTRETSQAVERQPWKYWSDTIWQRTVQYRLTWRRHDEAFAEPRALRLPNDDDDIETIGKMYGDGYRLSMLVDSDVYACVRLMLEGNQGNAAHARVPVSTVARSILDGNATKWSNRS